MKDSRSDYKIFVFEKQKKANVSDYFFVIIILLITIMMIILGMRVYNEMRATKLFTETSSSLEVRNDTDRLNNMWDIFFVILAFLALAVPIIAAFLIGAHPAFAWASVLLGMIVILMAVVANNVYDKIINTEGFSTVKSQLPKTTFIFDNIGQIITVFIGALILALFFGAKIST